MLKNEKGHALIYVLLFIIVIFILAIPLFQTVLIGTKEITIEMERDKNNYISESVLEVIRGFVEKNKINHMNDFDHLISTLNQHINNNHLFSNSTINLNLNKSNNSVTIITSNNNNQTRDDSKLVFTFRTFENAFETNDFIISTSKNNVDVYYFNGSKKKVLDSHLLNKIHTLDTTKFNQTLQYKYYWFTSAFPKSRENPNNLFLSYINLEEFFDYLNDISPSDLDLDDYENKNIYINEFIVLGIPKNTTLNLKNVWIGGNSPNENKIVGSTNSNLIINGSLYVNGTLNISNLNYLEINGDLVVLDSNLLNRHSLNINNVNTIKVNGSIISSNNLVITKNNMYLEAKNFVAHNKISIDNITYSNYSSIFQ